MFIKKVLSMFSKILSKIVTFEQLDNIVMFLANTTTLTFLTWNYTNHELKLVCVQCSYICSIDGELKLLHVSG